LDLTVTDGTGRTATASVSVTVTAPPPPLGASITSPANGSTVNGTVTVNMSATNASGTPTQFVLKQDNTTTLSTQSVASGSTATFAWHTTTGGVANGTHTLDLTVTDGAGRTATASLTVTVNNAPPPTAPTVNITSPVGSAWTGNSITFSATANGSAPLT